MKKSKHFRKDVIIARVIAGALVILLIVLVVLGVSLLAKSSSGGKDTENTQNTQSTQNTQEEVPDVDFSTEPEVEPETMPEPESESETESESESQSEQPSDETAYVATTSQVRLRKEPNTECVTISLLEMGVKLEVVERLDGWYKVIYDGQEGYVSADYVESVEE